MASRIFLFVLPFLGLLSISCATTHPTTSGSSANLPLIEPIVSYSSQSAASSVPGSVHPREKSYTTVSLFNGLWNYGPDIQDQLDKKTAVTSIHLEKDWAEDLLSLVTLGAVNVMEVHFNEVHPDALTPFHIDYQPGLPPGKSANAKMDYPGKNSYLFWGLVPVDGGVRLSNGGPDNVDLHIKYYDIERILLTKDGKGDPEIKNGGDFALQLLNDLVFSQLSSLSALLFVKSDWKYPLMVPGMIGTFRLQWDAESFPHK